MPKIELYPHNQAALNHLEEALKYTRRAAVIQPTGTGKSFVALAFIERRPNNSFLYLAPSTHIFNQLKHHAGHTEVLLHTTMMTYQKLCLLHEDELGKLEPDYIILDEFHRCGADDWGSAVDHLLALYVECFLIGFTATPVRIRPAHAICPRNFFTEVLQVIIPFKMQSMIRSCRCRTMYWEIS